MTKIGAQERWQRDVLERYQAFKMSGEMGKLRKDGLAVLKRTRLLTAEEWNDTFHERSSSKDYRKWVKKCRVTGERFGLAFWTVVMACLVKGFKPDQTSLVLESRWAQIRVVTEVDDPAFLDRLAYEAQRLGVYVVHCHGSTETTYLYMDFEEPPLPTNMPPRGSLFEMRLATPIDYPPEASQELAQRADKLKRELLKRLGYPVRQRIRNSPLVPTAKILKADEAPLPSGGIYGIVDDVWGDDDSIHDQERRKLTKSRRHNVRKRLDALEDQPRKTSGDASP